MRAPIRVALVIPAWNEPEAIGPVLDELPPDVVEQVLVVVGGADDPTAIVARARGVDVLLQRGRGYGAACWTGAQAALAQGAEALAFLDGDYADPPAALPGLLKPIEEGLADLVLGCRHLSRHPDALPPHARLGNQVVLLMLRLLLKGQRFSDLPSFKVIRADSLRALRMREMTYGWTVEMLVKAARAGLRIQEVGVDYRPRLGGRSKVAGTLGGSAAAAYKLVSCAFAYAR